VNVVAGDIGGTHARLARFRMDGGKVVELIDDWTVDSPGYSGPEPIIREYLRSHDVDSAELDGICVAVAGPIRDGVLSVPNLGWSVDIERFGDAVGFPDATLINDFVAIGHGVLALADSDWADLQTGRPKDRGTIAVLGPGTGLGHAFLIWQEGAYRVNASEGGHADFAPRTETEWALSRHLARRYGHASWERVVSGPGLLDIYRFLAGADPGAESRTVRLELEKGDAPAVISRHGTRGTDSLCEEALEILMSALGALAGNMALMLEAYGGVYIAGGIAPQIVDALRAGPFLEAFRTKGRLSELLEDVPVRVVLDEHVGLEGAARVAARGVSEGQEA
jgi:glucokinase